MRNLKFSTILIAFSLLIWSPVYLGCGTSAAQKDHDTLVTIYQATNVASAAFVAWDRAHQKSITDKAQNLADGEKALADYYTKRAPIVDGFTGTYSSITAGLIIGDHPSIAKAQQAYADLMNAYTAFKKVFGGS